jgi:hypothetical protein
VLKHFKKFEYIKEVIVTEDVITQKAQPRIEPIRDYGVPG